MMALGPNLGAYEGMFPFILQQIPSATEILPCASC